MEIVVELTFKTVDPEDNYFMGEDGEKLDPVDYLIGSFRDMPRDYVNFDVYEKKRSEVEKTND